MSTSNRPLSPHLQIYRLPLLALMSIAHRITGVGLVMGLVVLAWWLGCAAHSPESFARAQAILGHPLGLLCLFGWSVTLFFHLGHGIRHLLWEAGWGFELPTAYTTAKIALGSCAVLTAITWIAAFVMMS